MLDQNIAFVAAATGFGLGAGAIFSIGPQNLKLIQAGVSRSHAITVAATGYLSEILLVSAGICGIGAILETLPSFALATQAAGIVFLLVCAFKALVSKGTANKRNGQPTAPETRRQAIASMLAVSWLNPLVYAELVMFVGVPSSSFEGSARFCFALGALLAACLRFGGLPAFGRMLAPWLESARAQKAFNLAAGLLLLVLAAAQTASIA